MQKLTGMIPFSGLASALAMSVALGLTQVANAQEADASNDEEERTGAERLLDEIVVTATKKAGGQALQDTNVAMSAFGSEQLEAFQVRDVTGLSFKTPNVSLDDIGTSKGTANFSVRGLGVNSSIPSIDPAVGLFVDGVYLGVNAGVIFDTFDLDSVEVLRGPQGVLFGRNVTGGAVLLNTGDPTDVFTFKAKAAVESGFRDTGSNSYLQGVVSGPIVEDVLSAKLGVYYNDDKGWFENLFDPETNSIVPSGDGSNFGLSETTIVRGALKFTPTPDLKFVLKFEDGEYDGQGPAGQSHTNASGVNSFATNLAGPFGLAGDPSSFTFDRNSHDFGINTLGFNRSDWQQASLRMDWNVGFGNGTITNIMGWRDFASDGLSDIDASAVSIFDANFNTRQEQFSNELRYNGRFMDDKLDFTTGVFYFEQDLAYAEQRIVQSVLNFDGGGVQDHETIGIFASGEYQATERLSLNAGIRYTNEKKDAQIAQISIANAPCVIFSGDPRSTTFCPLDDFDNIDTSNWSPKIGFGYEATDSFRVYGHWARAFRAGGYNLRNTAVDPTDPLQRPGPFEDEQLDSFELGFKSEPVPGARLNGAIFFSQIKDLQRELNIAGGTAVVQQIINNSADADIFGMELEALWPVTEDLVLNGSLGVTQGEYTDVSINLSAPTDGSFDVPPGDDDLALEIPRLIPFTASAGFTYFKDTPAGEATVNFNYAHRDKTFYTDNNLGFINAQDRVDFSVGLDVQDTGVNIALYGKNATDEVLFGNDTQLSNGTFAPLAKGRVFGIELTYEH